MNSGSSAAGYEVVHWINGRIRLRIPRLAHDKKFAQRLGEALMLLPVIKQARVNAHSASLVVTYQVEARKAKARTDFGAECRHRVANANQAILPQLVDCIRRAAGTDAVQLLAPEARPAIASGRGDTAASDGISYVDRLGLPVLGIGLSAGLLFGLAVPGAVVGVSSWQQRCRSLSAWCREYAKRNGLRSTFWMQPRLCCSRSRPAFWRLPS